MENLVIQEVKDTFFTPGVNFDASTGKCELVGESYLEDTFRFYEKLTAWVNEYANTVKKPISFNFKLTYFNTSSSKGILDIIKALKRYENNGGKVTVNWYYPKDDDDNLEEAEDFIADTNLNIKLIPY